MGKHLVFLYGTLKTGQYFNEWLLKQGVTFGRSIGTGRTVVKFPLVLVSCFKLPFLLHAEGTGHRILGEIFEVDEDKMEVVDVFEGAPTLYERVNIEVEVLSADGGGSVPRELTTSSETKFPPPPCPDSLQITSRYVQCHAYTVSNFKPTLLNLPHLEEYTCPWPNIEEYQRFMDEHNGTALVVHETALKEKGTDAEEAKRLASETVKKFERIKQLLT